MISVEDKGASEETLEVAEPGGVAVLENLWHAVLGGTLNQIYVS